MDDNGSELSDVQKVGELEFLEGIPAGAYHVDEEGNFLYCNQEAARILGYDSSEELLQRNIYDLYFDRKYRIKVLDRTRDLGGRMKSYIRWKRKDGSEVVVNDFAEFVYDENGKEAGVRGIFVEATYEKLFDDLNSGIYRVGPDKKTIELVNKAVAKIFGFESPEDMRGIDISKLYRHAEDYVKFMRVLEEEEKVENYPLEMIRTDGEHITISVSCHLLKNNEGEIIGREGTFTDVTKQKRYKKLLEQPLGVYEVEETEGGKPIITFCNEIFAEMFGFRSRDEVIGMNIHELYANEEDISRFRKALEAADKENRFLTDYNLRVKKEKEEEGGKGERFWIKIFCIPIEDEGGIIGRKGIVMDISDRMELERIIETRKGIQRFIHGFIAPMMSIHATSQVVAREIERGVGIKYGTDDMNRIHKKKRNILALFEEIVSISENLAEKMEKTIALCKSEEFFNEIYVQELTHIKDALREEIKDIVRRIIEVRELHKNAYDALSRVRSFVRTERSITDSRRITDQIRLCFVDLDELDSIYMMYLTQSILNKSKIAYHDVEGLRQLMMRIGDDGEEQQFFEFQLTNIADMIEEIIDMYRIDASLKGIVIYSPRGRIPEIEVSRSHAERMFSYVIQNAVKYSFRREGYIDVSVTDKGENVQIDIEDYGVGILPEEIRSGKIFEYGYRGEFSRDRNRTGSGIGLSEAKRIAEAHGGDVKVISVPVGNAGRKIIHIIPHKTAVSIVLPKKHNKKGDQNGKDFVG